MSKRRHTGDRVRLISGAGMCGESARLPVTIQMEDDVEWEPCMMGCSDRDCCEWVEVVTDPDPLNDGKQWMLCHISECEMIEMIGII